MPRNNEKSWNEDLVKALTARWQQAVQQKKQSQHQWRDGANAVQEVRKDIKLTGTGKIYNLPTPSASKRLTKTVYEICQKIIKGEEPMYPPGYTPLTNAELNALQDQHVDPYLESKIGKRSGAHAIFMAFHHGNIDSSVTRIQICQIVKDLDLCDEDMDANFHQGRMYGAWNAKDTLIKHGFLQEQKQGVTMTDRGFRSNGQNLYSITASGRKAIEYLLNKWPDTRTCPRTAGFRSFATTTPSGGGLSQSPGIVDAYSPFSVRRPTTILKKTKFSDNDELDLQQWLVTASVGMQKRYNIGKRRRQYLHNVCDDLMRKNPGLHLDHKSVGEGKDRQLYITIRSKPDGGISTRTPSSLAAARTIDGATPPPMCGARKRLFSEINGGKRLGGSETPSRNGLSAQEAAAAAAMNRFQAIQSTAASIQKQQHSILTKEEVINVDGDSDNDDDLDRKPPAKPWQDRNSFDYQPGDKVLVVMQSISHPQGPFEIVRVHISGHVTIINDMGNESKLEVQSVRPYMEALEDENDFDTRKRPPLVAKAPQEYDIGNDGDDNSSNDIIDLCESQEVTAPESFNFASPRRQPTLVAHAPRDNDGGNDGDVSSSNDVIDLFESQEVTVPENFNLVSTVVNGRDETGASGSNHSERVVILIDSWERSRNAAPRELRLGLAKQLETGSIKDVWPAEKPEATVVEQKLAYGDFAFEVSDVTRTDDCASRLSVVVERKLIRDLIQRSSAGDHWKQIQRMKDHCEHAIMLIENDTQLAARFDAYGSMGLDPNPSHHLIENDSDLYRFIFRAILSSKKIKFIQSREQKGSFRSLGALALMASESTHIARDAPESPPTAASEQQKLEDRLTSGGIHWQVAKAIATEIRSITALEKLLASCTATSAKEQLMLPILTLKQQSLQTLGNLSHWSSAIFHAIDTTPDSRSEKLSCYQEIKMAFGDAIPCDPATLLAFVYEEASANDAVSRALEYTETRLQAPKRQVKIELSANLKPCFPQPTGSSVYQYSVNPFFTSMAMLTTSCGNLTSNAVFIHVVEGETLLEIVVTAMSFVSAAGDFVTTARKAAKNVDEICSLADHSESDHRIILIRGLPPALFSAAKKPSYKNEVKVLCEMVFACLMLDYDYVILQAIRKKEDETHMILQQLALACYHYQFLTKDQTKNITL